MTARKRYWLLKSEPDAFSIDDLQRVGTEPWNGVRNYQARNFMRDDMRVGDGVLFYASGDEPGITGLAQVCKAAYPDDTALKKGHEYFDPKSKKENPTWFMVDIKAVEAFKRPVSLDEIKKVKALANMALIRLGRLSVQPVTPEEFEVVTKLGNSA